jgi:pimeloyl-ACP methyl ester carboxylesterase
MRTGMGISRHFVATRAGVLHYAESGEGPAVLFLHQTPRSWDEFREVLPLVGRRRRAIAMDTLGFGDSDRPEGPDTIERYAQGVLALLDAIGLKRASLVGHHTGGVIAVEVAATAPERVERLVLSSTPLVDAEFRRRHQGAPSIDGVARSPDGSHVLQLWRQRQPHYPDGRPDLLERFLVDALRAGERTEEGHAAVARYRMEERLPLLRCPVLLIGATEDPFAHPHLAQLAARIPGSRTTEIRGGRIPLPDQCPEAFAAAVLGFLED